MERIFSLEEVSLIIQAEEATLNRYQTVLKTYAKRFMHYGVSLTAEIGWGTELSHNISNIRPEIQSTYSAFIVCRITDGNGRIIESNDHDMFMDFAWPLSTFVNGRIYVFIDIDEDLFDMMKSCEEYFYHPY